MIESCKIPGVPLIRDPMQSPARNSTRTRRGARAAGRRLTVTQDPNEATAAADKLLAANPLSNGTLE